MDIKIEPKPTLTGEYSTIDSVDPASKSYEKSMAIRQESLIQSLARKHSLPKELVEDSINWKNFIDTWNSGKIPSFPGVIPVCRDQIDKEVSKAIDAIKSASSGSPVETILIDSITGGFTK